MSKYTTEVRFICETASGLTESADYTALDEILDKAAPKIFSFDYPLFDENYRLPLEKKILKHYYTREIGEETVGLWKLRLDDRMNMIMPYYNKLYESELLKYNPLIDTDFTIKKDVTKDDDIQNSDISHSVDKHKRVNDSTNKVEGEVVGTSETASDGVSQNNGNETGSSSSNTGSWNLFSDTPQGGINGIANAYNPNLSDQSYLTDARNITENESANYDKANENKEVTRQQGHGRTTSEEDTVTTLNVNEENEKVGTTEKNGSRVAKNVEDYLEKITGKRGTHTYGYLIKELRQTFLNIDAMIIDELSDLFMNLW